MLVSRKRIKHSYKLSDIAFRKQHFFIRIEDNILHTNTLYLYIYMHAITLDQSYPNITLIYLIILKQVKIP